MGKNRGRGDAGRFRALAELYARLPVMRCQGLCSDSCYSLVQTPVERDYVQARAGVELGLVQTPPSSCPALGMLNRCLVYEVRPLICRLWGMTAGMRCQYGCEPEGGFLTGRQAYEFLAQAAEISGDAVTARLMRRPFEEDPERAERLLLALQRERDLDYEDRVRRAGDSAVFLVAPGRLLGQRPRTARHNRSNGAGQP